MIKDFKCFDPATKIMYNVAFPTWNGCIEVWKNNKPQSETEILSPICDKEPLLLPCINNYGKRLCVGDILRGYYYQNGNEIVVEVVFELDGFKVRSYKDQSILIDKGLHGIDWFIRDCMRDEFEIVGNIYENPSLRDMLQ